MPKVSVTVITKNEAVNLAAALDSVAWADEILVVDSGSTDGTTEIARRYTDRVITRDWQGYSAQKNYAASAASHDWILSLDADERVTSSLADEIRGILSVEPNARGYRIPRIAHYLGCWIRSTDWYPDYQLRLYDRRVGRWTPRPVHESVTVEGSIGQLSADLEHYPYRDISHHLSTIDRYTTLSAAHQHERGARANICQLAVHPALAFLRNYVLRRGAMSGSAGLVISILNSYYVFLKFAKLWELQRAAGRAQEPR